MIQRYQLYKFMIFAHWWLNDLPVWCNLNLLARRNSPARQQVVASQIEFAVDVAITFRIRCPVHPVIIKLMIAAKNRFTDAVLHQPCQFRKELPASIRETYEEFWFLVQNTLQ